MNSLFSVTILTGILTLIKMMVGFVVAKVIAIYAGPAGLAILGQMQGLATSVNGVMTSPVSNGLIKHTAKSYEVDEKLCIPWWRASTFYVLLFLIIILPIGISIAKPLSQWLFSTQQYSLALVLFFVIMPFSIVGTTISSVLNAQKNYIQYVISLGVAVVISGLVMVTLIIKFAVLGAVLAITVQSAIIGVVLIFFVIRRPWFRYKYWFGASSASNKKSMAGYIIMTITSSISLPLSLILIRKLQIAYLGIDAAGQWQSVWKISETYLSIITISLGTYYLPKLSCLNNSQEIIKEIHYVIIRVLPIVLVMAILIYLFRDQIIALLFTKDFYKSRNLFGWQLIGDVIKVAGWIYAYPMIAKGTFKRFTFLEITFCILFVILSYVLIPLYGLLGTNIAYTVIYSFYFIFVITFKRKLYLT